MHHSRRSVVDRLPKELGPALHLIDTPRVTLRLGGKRDIGFRNSVVVSHRIRYGLGTVCISSWDLGEGYGVSRLEVVHSWYLAWPAWKLSRYNGCCVVAVVKCLRASILLGTPYAQWKPDRPPSGFPDVCGITATCLRVSPVTPLSFSRMIELGPPISLLIILKNIRFERRHEALGFFARGLAAAANDR